MTLLRKNLVLTLAHGYRWSELCVFINSLIDSGFAGDIVIFGSRLNRQTRRNLEERGVRVIRVHLPLVKLRNIFLIPGWKPWRCLLAIIPSFTLRRALGKTVFNIMCARFAYFHHFLQQHIDLYDKVLLADVRDVCFQADPFQAEWGASIVSFLEEGPIRNSRANSKWLRQAYGDHLPPAILDQTSSCAGVTIGTSTAMLDYLTQMVRELCKVQLMTPVAGVDQAVHNFLFHGGHLKDSATLGDGNTICMTMGADQPHQLDHQGQVVTSGTVVAILHQYDRIPALNQIIRGKYEETTPSYH